MYENVCMFVLTDRHKSSNDMKNEILEIITQHKFEHISSAQALSELLLLCNVGGWVAYDWNNINSRPKTYGKYFVHRKDGKVHWETWNESRVGDRPLFRGWRPTWCYHAGCVDTRGSPT